MLEEIAAFAATCLTLLVVALACVKGRRPPAGAKRAKATEPDTGPLISNKLELPSSRTGGGSKGGSHSRRIKKDSKASKQKPKTPQLPPPSQRPAVEASSTTTEPKKKRFMRNEMPPMPSLTSSMNQDEGDEAAPVPAPADAVPEPVAAEGAAPAAEPPAPVPVEEAPAPDAPAPAEGEKPGEVVDPEGGDKDDKDDKESAEDVEKSKKKKKHKKKHKKKKHRKHKKSDDDDEEDSKKKSKRHKKKKKHKKTPVDHVAPEAPVVDKPGETKFENYPGVNPAAPTPENAPAPESDVPEDPNAASPAQIEAPPQPAEVAVAGSAAGSAANRLNELIAKNEAAAAAAAQAKEAQAAEKVGEAAGGVDDKDLFNGGVPEDIRVALEKKFTPQEKKKRPSAEQVPVETNANPGPNVGKPAEAVAASERKGTRTDLESKHSAFQPPPPPKKVASKEGLRPPSMQTASPTPMSSPGKAANKPKVIPRDIKAERITKLNLKRGREAYPTMNDVLSDWDSKEEAPPGATSPSPVAPTSPTPQKAAEKARIAAELAEKARLAAEDAKKAEEEEAKRYNEEQEAKLRQEEEAASERHRKKQPAASNPVPVQIPVPDAPPVPEVLDKDQKTPAQLAEMERVKLLRATRPLPMPIKRNSWEEKLATGKVVRPKHDYPTFGDIVSDWETAADDKPELKKSSKKK